MSDWVETTLGEIAEVIGGGTPKTSVAEYWGGDIPWLTPRDLTSYTNTYISRGERNITQLGLKKSSTKLMPAGAVLLTSRAPIGYVAIATNEISTNQGFKSLFIDNKQAHNVFIYYWIKDNVEHLQASGSGTTFMEISGSVVKSIKVSLPPLPEQKAIAVVLSSLDDKIDLLHRQNKTLESTAETLFRQWFIEDAQDDWETVCIADVAKTNLTTVKGDYTHQEILYLDTGSITEGKIEALQPYELKDAPSRAKRLVQHNDIIISTVRPNHKHYGFIKNPEDNLVVSTGFCVISCTKIDPNFMYSLLTQEEMTEYLSILAEASTSTYPSLKPSDIEAVEFQLPPDDLLEKFTDITSENWKKIAINYKQIKTLESLRDTLLPKLMSGDVRVEFEEAA